LSISVGVNSKLNVDDINKAIKENNIKGLRVGELKKKYGSMLFLDEED
jgi:hypothetical protein